MTASASRNDGRFPPLTTISANEISRSEPDLRSGLYWLVAGGLLAVAVYGVIFAVTLWRPLPYWDYWASVKSYQAWREWPISTWQFIRDHVIAQNNEHRLPITFAASFIENSFVVSQPYFARGFRIE